MLLCTRSGDRRTRLGDRRQHLGYYLRACRARAPRNDLTIAPRPWARCPPSPRSARVPRWRFLRLRGEFARGPARSIRCQAGLATQGASVRSRLASAGCGTRLELCRAWAEHVIPARYYLYSNLEYSSKKSLKQGLYSSIFQHIPAYSSIFQQKKSPNTFEKNIFVCRNNLHRPRARLDMTAWQ